MRNKTYTSYFRNYARGERKMKKKNTPKKSFAGLIKVVPQRVNALRDQFINTPQVIDNERLQLMVKTYKEPTGYVPIIRRGNFFEYLLDNKTLYIDDNFFVGSMASSP